MLKCSHFMAPLAGELAPKATEGDFTLTNYIEEKLRFSIIVTPYRLEHIRLRRSARSTSPERGGIGLCVHSGINLEFAIF